GGGKLGGRLGSGHGILSLFGCDEPIPSRAGTVPAPLALRLGPRVRRRDRKLEKDPRRGGVDAKHLAARGRSGRAMAAEHPAGNEEDGVAALVIATAAALLESERSGVPKAFVDALFSQAVPEDVVRYDARELATLAKSAWAFLAKRKSGAPKIRFENPAEGVGERLRHISVLEIANDDMPFLVDSVLGELAERGVDILLVAHPVLTLARDRQARLTAFGTVQSGTPRRESFIHIHMGRIEDEA